MAGRLNRFLNLEGARPATEPSARPASGRFSSSAPASNAVVPLQGNSPQPESSELVRQTESIDPLAALQAERRAQISSGIALDDRAEEEQPFIRCGQCETDNQRNAVRCTTCSADLTTPMQRAFNQHLWETRRAQSLAEQSEIDARAKLQEDEPRATTPEAAQRALGEALAKQIREKEGDRLSWMDGGQGNVGSASTRPLGMRLLDQIPNPLWRLVTACSLLVLATWLGYLTITTPREQRNNLVQFFFFALLFLFLPMGRRRRGFFNRGNRW